MNWGIVGLGKIAHAFVKDLQLVDGAHILSAASRDLNRARDFAESYGIENAYGSYAELFRDPNIDIVYIGTPHDSHAALSIEASENGKHVLCEKPLAVNSRQVRQMIEAAENNGVFLMEALWSRFNPSIMAIYDRIREGEIGEVNYVNVDFTFLRNDPDDHRLLRMDLAGGSLLDMGIYPVFLTYLLMGVPDQILALAKMHPNGADQQTAAIFKYADGVANVMSGFQSQSEMCARIYGTKGSILIDPVWHETSGFTIVKDEGREHFTIPPRGKGFTHEIEETMKCVANGKQQSDLWSLQDSLNLIGILDEIRRQIDLKYPFE